MVVNVLKFQLRFFKTAFLDINHHNSQRLIVITRVFPNAKFSSSLISLYRLLVLNTVRRTETCLPC